MGLGITSDTLWLADFAPARDGWKACELGCGSGEISRRLARRARMTVVGIDIDAGAVVAARSQVIPSDLHNGSAVEFLEMSIAKAPQNLGRFSFDIVVCNPPFLRRGAGRSSPHPARQMAREETAITLTVIVICAAGLLKPGGIFCGILPPGRLTEMISLGAAHGLPVTHLQPIHPDPAKPARRVLVRATKGSRSGLEFLPPLTGGT